VLENPYKIFVRDDSNNRLCELYFDGSAIKWFWTDHGAPPGTKVTTSPGALLAPPQPKFFVGTADGRLFERYWDPPKNNWFWTDHGAPPILGEPKRRPIPQIPTPRPIPNPNPLPRTVALRLFRTTQYVDAEYAGAVAGVSGIIKKVRNKGQYRCHLSHQDNRDPIRWVGASIDPGAEKTDPSAGMPLSGTWKGSHTVGGPMPPTLECEIEY
jgi:hypothetical protein